jgi:hypothetical protein
VVSELRQAIAHKVPAVGSVRKRTRVKIENDEASKELYLRAIPKVFTVSAAIKASGAHHADLPRWRKEDPDFLAREQAARDIVADQMEAEAVRRGMKGVRQPVYQGGLLAGYQTVYSDSLLTLMLKASRPDRFRERSEVQVTPIIKVVEGFDPAALL